MEECATSYVIKETQIKTIPSTPTGMAQTRNPADPKGREGVERRLARTLGMQNGTATLQAVSYTHLTLPTNTVTCRSRWSPYH